MGFLNIDSSFMKYLGRFADIMILGFWSIICCLPIFTIGTSISATYSVTLKMVRDEECYITKDFLKGFKENLKQSTIAWVCLMLIGIIFYLNFQVMNGLTMRFETICRAILIVIAVYLFFISGYLFPLIVLYYYPNIFPLILLFCISGVCYLNSMMLRTIFDKYLIIAVDEGTDWEKVKNAPSSK